MAPRPRCSRLLSLCLLALLLVAAARPRVHIGDDLEDVVDSEEPEAWQREATKRAPLIEGAPLIAWPAVAERLSQSRRRTC